MQMLQMFFTDSLIDVYLMNASQVLTNREQVIEWKYSSPNTQEQDKSSDVEKRSLFGDRE